MEQLHLEQPVRFVASFNRPNLNYTVLPKRGDFFSRLAELLQEHKGESVIIYCSTIRGTEDLATRLRVRGFDAQPYHSELGDLRDRDRNSSYTTEPRSLWRRSRLEWAYKSNIRLIVH